MGSCGDTLHTLCRTRERVGPQCAPLSRMKRDPRLQGLSSEHHNALVLARRMERAHLEGRVDAALVAALRATFEAEIAPHFAIEEDVVLPALLRAGETAVIERTAREHAEIRDLLARAGSGDLSAVGALGAALAEHVRFEERELFPACERCMQPGELDEVARRAPKHG